MQTEWIQQIETDEIERWLILRRKWINNTRKVKWSVKRNASYQMATNKSICRTNWFVDIVYRNVGIVLDFYDLNTDQQFSL